MPLRLDTVQAAFGKLGGLGARSFALRIAGLVSTFGLGIVLARSLGPAEYGVYGLVTTVAALAMTIAQLGTPQLAVRDLSVSMAREQWGKARQVIRTFTTVTLVMAVILGTAAIAISALWFPRFLVAVIQGALLTTFMALTALSASELRGLGAIIKGQAMDIFARPTVVLVVIGALLLAGNRMSAAAALWVQVAVALVSTMVSLWWIRQLLPRAPGKGPDEPLRWLGSALPLGAVDVLRTLDGAYGMILVGWLATAVDLGAYRVAVACMVLSSMPVTILHVIFAPDLARLHAEARHEELQRLLTLTSTALTGIMLTIAIGAWFFGKFAITLVFGAPYAGAWLPLFLLTCSQLIYGVFGMGNILLAMCGGERQLIVIWAAAVGTALLAAIPLTHGFGGAGAASASLITPIIINTLSRRYARRHLGVEITPLSLLTQAQKAPHPSAP